MADAWTRRADESKEAYAAFQHYLREGTIDAAFRASNPQSKSNHANGAWTGWSAKYDWVARAAAYADHLAEQNRLLWERRRRELQERDWAQADRMRAIVDEAQIMADQFLRSKTTTIPGTPTVVDADGNIIRHGTPTRQIITTALAIEAVSKVMIDASKQQRLATGESTENVELSGAALIAAIERQLARVADASAAGHAPSSPDDGAGS